MPIKVTLMNPPTDEQWIECKQRALVTMYGKGLDASKITPPDSRWKHDILEARHSPIRCLTYKFLIQDIPSNIATHFARHVHAQPYVSSLRNDRQEVMDGDSAPRDTPVNMIFDVNAEELMVIANKRMCGKAADITQGVCTLMCIEAIKATPELYGLLVPWCEFCGGVCHEMHSCCRTAKYFKSGFEMLTEAYKEVKFGGN